MTEPLQLCASDKEIFDVLMARKKGLSEAVLFRLAQDRRIYCSHQLDREGIADYLSELPHDYNDLQTIIERAEQSGRGEKATFVTFQGELDPEQIRKAVEKFAAMPGAIDKLSIPMQAPGGLTAIVGYTEFDYGKTRLTQRQQHEATLVFSIEGGKTVVRFPSTERARLVVDGIRTALEAIRTAPLEVEQLSLGGLGTPEARTRFFTKLMSAIPDHSLQTVVSLKVASFEVDAVLGEDEEALASDVLAVVKRASLSGENLIATPQFRSLQEAGFFISAARWRSLRTVEPQEFIQFEVSLEDPVGGTGLRYVVRHTEGTSETAHYKKLGDIRERNLLATLEAAAKQVLTDMAESLPVSEEAVK